MVHWWQEANDNLLNQKIQYKQLDDIVSRANTALREGVKDLLFKLDKAGVPVLIFSAGLGDILTIILKKHGAYNDSLHIIANFVSTNQQGIIDQFKGTMVHVFNKNEFAVKNTPYFDSVAKRPNVILTGDSLGDLGMSKGIEHEAILNIGFLTTEDKLVYEKYVKAWDVVILKDGTFNFVSSLITMLYSVWNY